MSDAGAINGAGAVMNGVFIDVEVDPAYAGDQELAAKLAEVCPVDIFAAGAEGVTIVAENLDECVLCELCLNASSPGAVKVIKLYDGATALVRA
jgi:NAD-dependent dihydropyrimidine dehydrogenase PreA subunit